MSEQQSHRGQVDRLLGQIVSHGRRFEGMTSEDRQWVITNPNPAIELFMAAVKNRNQNLQTDAAAADRLIVDVFTNENAESLGFKQVINARILNLVKAGSYEPSRRLVTLGDFANMTEQELRRQAQMGNASVSLVQAVLAQHGLRLFQP